MAFEAQDSTVILNSEVVDEGIVISGANTMDNYALAKQNLIIHPQDENCYSIRSTYT